jgi:predicted dinucleotide-binding enzyme
MRIGILGSAVVAKALGTGYVRHGHEVRLSSREPGREDLVNWAATAGTSAAVGTPAEAAEWGEIVVLATAGSASVATVEGVASALDGKVLIDATNPLSFASGAPALFVGTTDSLGEQVQRAVPGARVVKAYNTVGNTLFVDPDLPGGPPTMLLAGDDDEAKQTVADLLESTGWDVADLGGIESSRWLEAICMAWVTYGLRTQTWDHAFRLLRP